MTATIHDPENGIWLNSQYSTVTLASVFKSRNLKEAGCKYARVEVDGKAVANPSAIASGDVFRSVKKITMEGDTALIEVY